MPQSAKIHPTAIISPKAEVGENVSIGPYTIIHDNVCIGQNTHIASYCELGIETPLASSSNLIIGKDSIVRSNSVFYQGSVLGDSLRTGHGVIVRENTVGGINLQIGSMSDINGDCSFGDYTRLHSNVFVGKAAKIGNFVWLLPHTILTNDPHPPSDVLHGVIIEDYAILAARTTILPGITIKHHSLIAAGSVVTRDTESHTVFAGVPAKKLCMMNDIKLTTDSEKSAYPWTDHFHRGYPEHIVQQWIAETKRKM